MQRPVTRMQKRPAMPSASVAKTSKEAAIQLVRLEFDAARLEAGIEQASNRVHGYQHELKRNREQRQHLLNLMRR